MNPWTHPLVQEMLVALEIDLQLSISHLKSPPYKELYKMMEHHFGWDLVRKDSRGKRVRPLLTLLAYDSVTDKWRPALPVASSIELIHNFSLLHDDIQDRSLTRRGQPTVWKVWGEAQAINTGDALFVLAQLASSRLQADPNTILDIRRTIDQACLSLTMGQFLDLAYEHLETIKVEQYLTMIHGKTAQLLAASAATGALLAQIEPARCAAFHDFGEQLGVAFQILDDILGISGKPEVTGKPAGDDLHARKKTLPVLFGMRESPRFRELWIADPPQSDGIEAMTAELNACGAIEFAMAQVDQYSRNALAALERADPQYQAGELLHALTLNLMQRDL